jgi:hypothetical protein
MSVKQGYENFLLFNSTYLKKSHSIYEENETEKVACHIFSIPNARSGFFLLHKLFFMFGFISESWILKSSLPFNAFLYFVFLVA